jgi:hypothetical protein
MRILFVLFLTSCGADDSCVNSKPYEKINASIEVCKDASNHPSSGTLNIGE